MAETLEDLIVDETEMDRALLHEVLAPYVRLSRDTGQIIPTAAFAELSATGNVIVHAISRKAGCALGIHQGPETARSTAVSGTTGVKDRTTKPTVVARA